MRPFTVPRTLTSVNFAIKVLYTTINFLGIVNYVIKQSNIVTYSRSHDIRSLNQHNYANLLAYIDIVYVATVLLLLVFLIYRYAYLLASQFTYHYVIIYWHHHSVQ